MVKYHVADRGSKMNREPAQVNFTTSFKKTIARFETLSAGKKADYTRTTKKNVSARSDKGKQKVTAQK
jgi:hypothetical protein